MAKSNDNSKAALIDELNGLLADHFALYMKTKNFHWHVVGRHFRDLHLLFDEQAAQIQAQTDVIGERVRKQNGMTLTSAGSRDAPLRVTDSTEAVIASMKVSAPSSAVKRTVVTERKSSPFPSRTRVMS